MKRFFIYTLCALAFVGSEVYGWGEQEMETSPTHFSFAFRGGFFFPNDDDFRRVYGKWTNDIYFIEFGWYPIKNFSVSFMVGGYYQDSNTVGEITLSHSGENLELVLAPMELGLSYLFRFKASQFVVPYIGAGYDAIYFHEDADPGSPVEGWKEGYTFRGGMLLLLDRLEPSSAWKLFSSFGIDNSYLEIGARYTQTMGGGLDLSGPTATLGVVFEF